MREGRRAHAGVISGVGIRPAFDPDHIRHHPDVARPPPPSISTPHQRRESVGEGGRWQGVGGRGLKSQVPWHAGSTPHTPWQHAACHTHPYIFVSDCICAFCGALDWCKLAVTV